MFEVRTVITYKVAVRALSLALVFISVGCGRVYFERRAERDGQQDGSFDADIGDTTITDATITDAEQADATDGSRDSACDTALLPIAADADDGEIDTENGWLPQGENVSPESAFAGIYMGYWTDGVPGQVWGYFRFQLPSNIMGTFSVRRAHLLLDGAGVLDWQAATHALNVHLEQSQDAAVVTMTSDAPDDPLGRPVTAAGRWPSAGGLDWQIGATNQSPDMAMQVQSVVDAFGTTGGDHVQFWVAGDHQERAELMTHDLGRGTGQVAQMFIEWCSI